MIPPHPLTDFKIQKYYHNEPRFNGVYSRDTLTYIINLDDYSDIGTQWIALYAINNNVAYFDSFGIKDIPKEIKKCIYRSTIIANILIIEAYDSVMCGNFCKGFIEFMLKGKSLTDFTNLLSPNSFLKNDDIVLICFMTNF